MTEKLTTAAAVRVLLDGGCIAEMCPNTGKTRKYTMYEANDIWGIGAGHITPGQFNELIGAGVIDSTHESRTDKYGNIYNFYKIKITWERES